MKSVFTFSIIAALCIAGSAQAKTAKKHLQAKPVLSRNISYTGSAVDGKYHSAPESIAEVESEKSLNALMGIRKNFRDRLGLEQARLETGEGKAK
jgi:hypothetical protein